MNKYRNKPVQIGAEKYRSGLEAKRHQDLLLLERSGTISNLRREVPYVLIPGVRIQGRMRPPIRYVADFVYTCDGKQVVEDAKGMRTPVYRLKRHMMAAILGIEIREV